MFVSNDDNHFTSSTSLLEHIPGCTDSGVYGFYFNGELFKAKVPHLEEQ